MFHMLDKFDRFDRFDSSDMSDRTFLLPKVSRHPGKYFSDFLIWLTCVTSLTGLISLTARACLIGFFFLLQLLDISETIFQIS